jgi:sortase A
MSTMSAAPAVGPGPAAGGPGAGVRLRQGAHLLGEVLITLGVVVLLFVVYLLAWTNVRADSAAASLTGDLRQQWASERPHTGGAAPTVDPAALKVTPGEPFAIMRIPRLGKSWSSPVIQPKGKDIALGELAEGVVHYKQTALPGQVGNFAVAGHRATHGQPFADLDELRIGDTVIVETQAAIYTYVVDNDPNRTIVLPTDVWVIEPVPGHPTATPTQALITLTTCNPRWNSSHRMIVFGHLVSTQVK